MGILVGFLRLAFLGALSILIYGVPYSTGGERMDFDLDAYQWKNRILLVFAPSSDADAYKRQTREFEGQEDGIADRDLIVLELFENGGSRLGNTPLSERVATLMRRQFGVEAGKFSIVLIGKDGTVKLRSPGPISVSEIFSLIDAMPMRKREMIMKGEKDR